MESETEEKRSRFAVVDMCFEACEGIVSLIIMIALIIVGIFAIYVFFGPLIATFAVVTLIVLLILLVVVYRYKQQHPESRKANIAFKLLAIIVAVAIIVLVVGGGIASDPSIIPSILANPSAVLIGVLITGIIVGSILICVGIPILYSRRKAKQRELESVTEPKVPGHCPTCGAPLRGDEKFCGSCGAAVEKK